MKKIRNSILVILILMISICIVQTPSLAAGNFNVNAKTSLMTGETTTLTITANQCGGTFSISSSDNSIVSVNGDTSPWIEKESKTVTLKANKAGKATITVTPTDVSDSDTEERIRAPKSVTITVTEPAPPPVTDNKSGDANLKSITVAGKTYTDPNQDFTIKVGSDVSSTEVSAQTSSSAAKVSGTGRKELSTGSNIVKLTVTAENGAKKEYTIRINKAADTSNTQPNRTDTPSDNQEPTDEPDQTQEEPELLRLTYLMIEDAELSPEFDSEIFEYTVEVTNMDKLDIVKLSNSEDALIEITGNDDLVDGENIIIIKLTKDEEEVEYKITATKTTVVLTEPEEANTEPEEETSFLDKYGWMIGTAAVLVLIIIIILIFIIKSRKDDRPEPRFRHYDDGGFDE